MFYTVRYTHLEYYPRLQLGELITSGDKIGRMGNTGASLGNHLHIDCIRGRTSSIWHLYEMENGTLEPAPRQLNYFIDNELFKTDYHITTYYNDPEYQKELKKIHPAYDIVPVNRKQTTDNYDIFWNRSMKGEVLKVGNDRDYGFYAIIGFDA